MDKRQYMRENTSESGVALVFALAMLALLLIMLIGFLASAIFEQRIAYNQSGQSITRTIARSALQQASNMLAVYDGIKDEIPAFTGYAEEQNKTTPLADDTPAWRMTPLSSINHTGIDMGVATDLIHALLKNRGINPDNYVWDKEISGKENTPQWVPMIVKVGTQHSHITGRFAYTIIPNLGIEPELLNHAAQIGRVGEKYKELPFSGLELGAGWQNIFKQPKWMSLDMLGSRYVHGSSGSNPWTTYMTSSDPAREDFREKDKTTFMEAVNTFFTTDQDLSVDYDADRIKLADVGAKAKEIAGFIADGTLKEQIAANIVDYLDKEPNDKPEKPTSDVEAKDWLTSTTHPTYTGNEKTPYINQIVPALSFTATYSRTYTDTGNILNRQRRYIQKLSNMKLNGKVYVELVNIYPENLKAKKVVLKGLKVTFKDTAQVRGGSQTEVPSITIPGLTEKGGKPQKINFGNLVWECDGDVTVGGTDIIVSANNYNVLESEDLDFSGSMSVSDLEIGPYNILQSILEPVLEVKLELDKLEFDRAILYDENNQPVDYVKGMSLSGKNFIVDTIATGDEAGVRMRFNSNNQTKYASHYASFSVIDPRCNLGNDGEWMEGVVRNTTAELMNADDLKASDINFGAANEFEDDDDKMANSDPKKEKDLEVATDPAKLSTGFIRNGVMQSIWELGFIHRGKPWQTINLKSTDDSKDKTYFNDGMLLDEIAPTYDEPDKEKVRKYNINYPYTHFAAFGPLAKGLKYCPVNKSDIVAAGGLYPEEEGTSLNDDQWMSLRKWIAWKCYESNGGKPSKFDNAKNYHFYRHRGYLANVISDWALNCPDSPYYPDKDKVKEVHLEELITKIVPLTRAGEPYEYFTIYIVAQTIKDVGGLTAEKDMVYYDRNGGKVEGKAQQGRWDPDFDEVTGQVFMVARIKRNLDCQDAASCRDGKHVGGCQYGITVIENYTINEL